jgi:molybdopterin synthase sulfur carrier subunit
LAVTVVFLGKLADLAGAPEQDVDGPLDWDGLLAALPGPVAEEARGERTRIALNGELVTAKTGLRASDGDEIALLPPVSGG